MNLACLSNVSKEQKKMKKKELAYARQKKMQTNSIELQKKKERKLEYCEIVCRPMWICRFVWWEAWNLKRVKSLSVRIVTINVMTAHSTFNIWSKYYRKFISMLRFGYTWISIENGNLSWDRCEFRSEHFEKLFSNANWNKNILNVHKDTCVHSSFTIHLYYVECDEYLSRTWIWSWKHCSIRVLLWQTLYFVHKFILFNVVFHACVCTMINVEYTNIRIHSKYFDPKLDIWFEVDWYRQNSPNGRPTVTDEWNEKSLKTNQCVRNTIYACLYG